MSQQGLPLALPALSLTDSGRPVLLPDEVERLLQDQVRIMVCVGGVTRARRRGSFSFRPRLSLTHRPIPPPLHLAQVDLVFVGGTGAVAGGPAAESLEVRGESF
jgi:hypothetical protein